VEMLQDLPLFNRYLTFGVGDVLTPNIHNMMKRKN